MKIWCYLIVHPLSNHSNSAIKDFSYKLDQMLENSEFYFLENDASFAALKRTVRLFGPCPVEAGRTNAPATKPFVFKEQQQQPTTNNNNIIEENTPAKASQEGP